MCECDFVYLLLADQIITFFIPNTPFLNWFIHDVSKKSGKEQQNEPECFCSNIPF